MRPSSKDTLLNYALLLLGVTGLSARFCLSNISYGTNDVDSWFDFASQLRTISLFKLYASEALFNHPPLAALIVKEMAALGEYSKELFPYLLRFPGILAELLSAGIIFFIVKANKYTLTAMKAFCLFSWSLISTLVSGYHGNTDPLYVVFVLAALYLFSVKQKIFFAGIFLGLAINIKLIPLIFIPAFLFSTSGRKELSSLLSGLAVTSIPFVFGIIFGGKPFFENVFMYNSQLDYWGFQLFLLLFKGNHPEYATIFDALINGYLSTGRYLIFALIIVLCLMSRRHKTISLYELCALSFAIFAVFAPGFGGQYFVLLPPLVLLFSLKWGFRLALITGLNSAASYFAFLVNWMPLQSVHNATAPKLCVLFSFLTWVALAVFLFERLKFHFFDSK